VGKRRRGTIRHGAVFGRPTFLKRYQKGHARKGPQTGKKEERWFNQRNEGGVFGRVLNKKKGGGRTRRPSENVSDRVNEGREGVIPTERNCEKKKYPKKSPIYNSYVKDRESRGLGTSCSSQKINGKFLKDRVAKKMKGVRTRRTNREGRKGQESPGLFSRQANIN